MVEKLDDTEAAFVAGWNACRKSLYAVCEDVQNEADRLQMSSKPGTASQEQHAEGYYAGTRYAAKSITRGFNSMEALDDDNLREAIAAWNRRSPAEADVLEVLEPGDSILGYIAGVVGVVEATSGEKFLLWKDNADSGRRVWKSATSGRGVGAGTFGGKPVFLSLVVDEIDGHRILFYEATSMVVHHDLVRAWLDKHIPQSAFQGDRLNHADAMNFHNVFSGIDYAARALREKLGGVDG